MTTLISRLRPDAAASSSDRRWLALGVIAIAQLMTALDATVVNIALPSAQQALAFGDGARQWVVTAYTLSFAGLLLLGGRVADALGQRRALQIALVGFALASLLAGLAPNLPVLIAGRALQGAFAALISPTALSLLAVTFTDPKERAKAFGIYGAVAGSGAAAGLLLGGVLTQYLDWRWCLYVNVIVATGTLLLGRIVLPSPVRRPHSGLDLTSAAMATGGLAAIVVGCGQAASHGWSSPLVSVPLVVGALTILAFGLRQQRVSTPLLPLHILADRSRAGAYLAAAAAVLGSFGMFLLLTYHLQVVLHYSALRAGLGVLPLTVANALSGYQIGTRLQSRLAPRVLIAGGLLTAAAGLALLTQLDRHSAYLTSILPAEVLVGAGMGALFPSAFALAMTGVEQRDSGVAAALVGTSTQIGSSVGTAILNTLAVSSTAAYLAAHAPSPTAQIDALVHGYTTATACSSVLLTAVAGFVFFLIPASRPSMPGQPSKEM